MQNSAYLYLIIAEIATHTDEQKADEIVTKNIKNLWQSATIPFVYYILHYMHKVSLHYIHVSMRYIHMNILYIHCNCLNNKILINNIPYGEANINHRLKMIYLYLTKLSIIFLCTCSILVVEMSLITMSCNGNW